MNIVADDVVDDVVKVVTDNALEVEVVEAVTDTVVLEVTDEVTSLEAEVRVEMDEAELVDNEEVVSVPVALV